MNHSKFNISALSDWLLFDYWMGMGSDLTSEFTTGPDSIQILILKTSQLGLFWFPHQGQCSHRPSWKNTGLFMQNSLCWAWGHPNCLKSLWVWSLIHEKVLPLWPETLKLKLTFPMLSCFEPGFERYKGLIMLMCA